MSRSTLKTLLHEIHACHICEAHLPLGPNPVLRASSTARILVVGQAPGTRVHATGIPWNDPSGDRLRDWMQLAEMPAIKLAILVGKYAQNHYLASRRESLADTVHRWQQHPPGFFPLPHPSPRNLRWFREHPWFEKEVLPAFQRRLATILQ